MTATRPVVVVGAGGHARVCVDLLLEDPEIRVVGCVGSSDGRPSRVPLLGGDEILPEQAAAGIRHAFVAVGANDVRRRLVGRLRADGWELVTAVSRSATVSPTVRLGANVAVMAGAVVNAFAELGDGVIVNTGATVDHDCRLDEWVHVAPGTHLAGTVHLEEGAFMGVGSSAIPGSRVGAWSTVGAGGVVVRDIPPGIVALGVPARSQRAAVRA